MALTKVTMGLLGGLVAKVQEIMRDYNIVLGEAKAATGTFVDFDIPAGVKRITVMLDGVSTNGSSTPSVQIGSGSVDSAGYSSTGFVLASLSVAGHVLVSNSFLLGAGGGTADVRNGKASLIHVGGNTWVFDCMLGYSSSDVSASGVGRKQLSATLDRIRITTVNGTDQFDAGTINVSWEF